MTKNSKASPVQLAIVVPCYNEEEILPTTISRLGELLDTLHRQQRISRASRIYFIDDGSLDQTWPLIEQACASERWIAGIKLAGNRGHQNALLAGLFTASGDAVISLDADLQDDISAIPHMLDAHLNGADVVYAVRRRRDTDSAFKRISAQGFYRFMQLLGARIVANHADYRLLSRRVVEHLREYREVNLFLRGIVPLVGFASAEVGYDRGPRLAGVSKYPLRKMLGLAFDGVTSFSSAPLRMVTGLGFLTFAASLAISAWVIYVAVFTDTAVPGWASTALPMYFLGGVQILCLGVIGEYVGKTYAEVKARPRYIIESVIDAAHDTADQD